MTRGRISLLLKIRDLGRLVSLGHRPVDGYRITKLDGDVKFRVTERKRGRIMRGRVCARVYVRVCAYMGGGGTWIGFFARPPIYDKPHTTKPDF